MHGHLKVKLILAPLIVIMKLASIVQYNLPTTSVGELSHGK